GGLIRSVTSLPQVPSGGGTFPRLRRRTHPERHIAPPSSLRWRYLPPATPEDSSGASHRSPHVRLRGRYLPPASPGTHPVAGRPLWPAVALESVGNGEAAHWLRTPRNTYG